MIIAQNISYKYDRKEVFSNISIHVEKGRFCALMGDNGSGKTTLLKCLARLYSPQSGEIILDGRNCKEYTSKQLAQKVSMVFQRSQTDADFTAQEIVLMGRNPYQKPLQIESEEDLRIVEECMRKTNTWQLKDSYPDEMSGGELQRVMIARALAQKTPVMLLDEPTSNLDIRHQFEIMDLLREICLQEEKTIVIVVHDLNLALQYCNQLILVHDGEIVHQGEVEEGLSEANVRKVFGVESCIKKEGSTSHIIFSKIGK